MRESTNLRDISDQNKSGIPTLNIDQIENTRAKAKIKKLLKKFGCSQFDEIVRQYNELFLRAIHSEKELLQAFHLTEKLFKKIEEVYEYLNHHHFDFAMTLKRRIYPVRQELKRELNSLGLLVTKRLVQSHDILSEPSYKEEQINQFYSLWNSVRQIITYKNPFLDGLTVTARHYKIGNSPLANKPRTPKLFNKGINARRSLFYRLAQLEPLLRKWEGIQQIDGRLSFQLPDLHKRLTAEMSGLETAYRSLTPVFHGRARDTIKEAMLRIQKSRVILKQKQLKAVLSLWVEGFNQPISSNFFEGLPHHWVTSIKFLQEQYRLEVPDIATCQKTLEGLIQLSSLDKSSVTLLQKSFDESFARDVVKDHLKSGDFVRLRVYLEKLLRFKKPLKDHEKCYFVSVVNDYADAVFDQIRRSIKPGRLNTISSVELLVSMESIRKINQEAAIQQNELLDDLNLLLNSDQIESHYQKVLWPAIARAVKCTLATQEGYQALKECITPTSLAIIFYELQITERSKNMSAMFKILRDGKNTHPALRSLLDHCLILLKSSEEISNKERAESYRVLKQFALKSMPLQLGKSSSATTQGLWAAPTVRTQAQDSKRSSLTFSSNEGGALLTAESRGDERTRVLKPVYMDARIRNCHQLLKILMSALSGENASTAASTVYPAVESLILLIKDIPNYFSQLSGSEEFFADIDKFIKQIQTTHQGIDIVNRLIKVHQDLIEPLFEKNADSVLQAVAGV